tara:strand:- start:934 stop:1500 length:567 start_codon:yes stop_codon:yes gene_type:complete
MDNKNHNDHNKQCSSMSASELDHKTDYCLTNLKILAKIKVGDKLCFDDTLQHFSLDEWSYTQPLTRWWSSEGRKSTIKSLDEFIAAVFLTIDNIYSNEVSEVYNGVENTYYSRMATSNHVFKEENTNLLLSFVTELRNAISGINNLKQTYNTDVGTVSALDIIIEKMNVRVKKIQGILQVQNHRQDDG